MNLEGRIFLWNDTPLQGLPWEDTTPFVIWVFHGLVWNRFPSTGWVLSNGGWYAFTLEASERDVTWSNGDTYRVQIDALAFGGLSTNATSHDTGDPGEFPPFGEIENVIIWNDPDNTQQWDVVTPIPDLQPYAIAVDGIQYPGPYDSGSPIGPIVVLSGSNHLVEANVTNEGSPTIRIRNTATLDDSCGSFVHMGEILQIGAGSSSPPGSRFSLGWIAPSLPFVGDCFLNYTVDYYNNVTESDEMNNSVMLHFRVEGPDLTPSSISVQAPSGNYSYPDASATTPPYESDVIPANPGDSIAISFNATNVGGYETGATLNVAVVDTGSVSGGPPISVLYSSGEVGPLSAGESIGAFLANYQIPSQTGYHCLNLTVDYGIGGLGNISEISESNNTFIVCFGVDVPDFTPSDVILELQNGTSLAYADVSVSNYVSETVYLFPGDLLNITSSVRNVGVFQSPAGVETQVSIYYVGEDPKNPMQGIIAEWTVPELSPGATAGPYGYIGYVAPSVLGNHYVNITVDNRSQIQEASEVNNTFTIHLFVGGPDVLPEYVNVTVDGNTTQYVHPASPNVEIDISSVVYIESTIPNRGNLGTGSTFVVNYTDNGTNIHTSPHPPMNPDDVTVINQSWANPGFPSIHTIEITADALGEIQEIDEINNLFVLTIVVKGPDLIPLDVTVDINGRVSQYQYPDSPAGPVNVDISEDILIDVTVLNQGDLPADMFSTALLEDGSLHELSGSLGPLASLASTQVLDMRWQNPQIPGDYTVSVSVDYLHNVSEVDETNNDFVLWFRVVGPDLVASNLLVNGHSYIFPVVVTGGTTVQLTGVAANLGNNDTISSFSASIYDVSQRNNPLLLLGIPSHPPGMLQWFNTSWDAPVGFFNLSIAFEVDHYDDIMEIDEGNNILEAFIVVVPPPPDLLAVNAEINGLPYTGPHEVKTGELLAFSASVTNIGGFTTGGPFDNAYYNQSFPGLPFERIVEGTLESGFTSGEMEAQWRAPTRPGTYTVVFHADYLNSIPELNETNNLIRFVIEVSEREEELNWKPVMALVFAVVLALLGIAVGYVRPLDRTVHLPEELPRKGAEAYRRQMRRLPIGEKVGPLGPDALLRKISRDRTLTIAVLAFPLPLIEIVISVLSYLTGMLRVPEQGNWITIGLIVNILILIIGLLIDSVFAKKGYKVPSEVIPPPDDVED